MKELIEKYLNNGLADFEGLEITGSVPVKQEVINDAIASVLQSLAGGNAEQTSAPAPDVMPTESAKAGESKAPKLPLKALVGMVKRAEVQAVEGKLIVHFTVQR
jgi:hypothetical protein